jgi:hypothetical protein
MRIDEDIDYEIDKSDAYREWRWLIYECPDCNERIEI